MSSSTAMSPIHEQDLFATLPLDLALSILAALPLRSVAAFSQTCSEAHALAQHPDLWRTLGRAHQRVPRASKVAYQQAHTLSFFSSLRARRHATATRRIIAAAAAGSASPCALPNLSQVDSSPAAPSVTASSQTSLNPHDYFLRPFTDIAFGTGARYNTDSRSSWRFMAPELRSSFITLSFLVYDLSIVPDAGLALGLNHATSTFAKEENGKGGVHVLVNGKSFVEKWFPNARDFAIEWATIPKGLLRSGKNTIRIQFLSESEAQYCIRDVSVLPILA